MSPVDPDHEQDKGFSGAAELPVAQELSAQAMRAAAAEGFADYIGPPVKCGHCGQRATGFASIGDVRYCHGDFDTLPTCYMRAQSPDFVPFFGGAVLPPPIGLAAASEVPDTPDSGKQVLGDDQSASVAEALRNGACTSITVCGQAWQTALAASEEHANELEKQVLGGEQSSPVAEAGQAWQLLDAYQLLLAAIEDLEGDEPESLPDTRAALAMLVAAASTSGDVSSPPELVNDYVSITCDKGSVFPDPVNELNCGRCAAAEERAERAEELMRCADTPLMRDVQARVRELEEALREIVANAESWHGIESVGTGAQRALGVIESRARRVLDGGSSSELPQGRKETSGSDQRSLVTEANRLESVVLDFLDEVEGTAYVSLKSLQAFLDMAEQVWPDAKPTLRGVRGCIAEMYVRSTTATTDAKRLSPECDGSSNCPASVHVHGCFASGLSDVRDTE